MDQHLLDAIGSDYTPCPTVADALSELNARYQSSTQRIQEDFEQFARGELQGRARPAHYPRLAVHVDTSTSRVKSRLAYGKVAAPGWHVTTVTRPHLFESYLAEQLELLKANHDAKLYVGLSKTPIPLTFALEHSAAQLSASQRATLSDHFALPNLAATHDEIVDGTHARLPPGVMPLSLFPAERVDYSLHRLGRYR